MAADWSKLYHDLLVEIAERLTQFKDYIAFGMVCRSWRLAAVKKNFRFDINDQLLLPKFPLLMLAPTTKGKPGIINYRFFYNLSNGKSLQVWLPKLIGKRCYTSRGWLITVGRDLGVNLFHPFVSVEIKLPNLKTFKNWRDPLIAGMIMVYAHFLKKCVLSSDPLAAATSKKKKKKDDNDDDYIIMVIYGSIGKLGYCKSGDKTWNMIDTGDRRGFFDLIYYRDFFYAINGMGDILVFERDNLKGPTKVLLMPEDLTEETIEQLYLVKSDGDGETLFVVFRDGVQGINGNYGTYNFQVFQVDLTTNTWDEVNNLGNKSFFLGHNSSISLSLDAASNSDIKPNCIYFTDDYWQSYWDARQGGGKDMGIYNLQTQTFEPHFPGKSFNRINPPMWI